MLGTQGLIFVVDASDKKRIPEAKGELEKVLKDREMKDAILLVFANKQDIDPHLEPVELQDELGLDKVTDRLWYVAPSKALLGEGLYEGLVSILILQETVNAC